MSINVSLQFSKVTKDPISSVCASNIWFNETFILNTLCIHVTLIFCNSHHHYFMTFMRLRAVRKWNVGITIALSTTKRWACFFFAKKKKKKTKTKFNYDSVLNAMHMSNMKHAIYTEYWTLRKNIDEISEKRKQKRQRTSKLKREQSISKTKWSEQTKCLLKSNPSWITFVVCCIVAIVKFVCMTRTSIVQLFCFLFIRSSGRKSIVSQFWLCTRSKRSWNLNTYLVSKMLIHKHLKMKWIVSTCKFAKWY